MVHWRTGSMNHRRVLRAACWLLAAAVCASGAMRISRAVAEERPSQHPRLLELAEIDAAFLVGAWETRNVEHGRDVRIIFTVWPDGRLLYHFDLGAGLIKGSTGTWKLTGDTLFEDWQRPDGSRGAGRGKIEKIDAETLHLTIIDNGDPAYSGLVRIYRRLGPPALS